MRCRNFIIFRNFRLIFTAPCAVFADICVDKFQILDFSVLFKSFNRKVVFHILAFFFERGKLVLVRGDISADLSNFFVVCRYFQRKLGFVFIERGKLFVNISALTAQKTNFFVEIFYVFVKMRFFRIKAYNVVLEACTFGVKFFFFDGNFAYFLLVFCNRAVVFVNLFRQCVGFGFKLFNILRTADKSQTAVRTSARD